MMELSPRERNLVILGLGFLLPLMLLRFLIFPLIDYKEALSSGIVQREKEIIQIKKKGEELLYLQSKNGGQKIPLNQQLDQILNQSGTKKRASSSTRPGGKGIALQLEGVTLAEATHVIYQLESSRLAIKIQSLEMKTSLKDVKLLSLQLVIEGF